MLLNKEKFYQKIANYYERDNYKGAEVFLADKEKELNEALSMVNYEQGRVYQAMERWEESLKKYEEAKKLMEENDLTHGTIYAALIENMRLVKEKWQNQSF